jgi:hypothetical protein
VIREVSAESISKRGHLGIRNNGAGHYELFPQVIGKLLRAREGLTLVDSRHHPGCLSRKDGTVFFILRYGIGAPVRSQRLAG